MPFGRRIRWEATTLTAPVKRLRKSSSPPTETLSFGTTRFGSLQPVLAMSLEGGITPWTASCPMLSGLSDGAGRSQFGILALFGHGNMYLNQLVGTWLWPRTSPAAESMKGPTTLGLPLATKER